MDNLSAVDVKMIAHTEAIKRINDKYHNGVLNRDELLFELQAENEHFITVIREVTNT